MKRKRTKLQRKLKVAIALGSLFLLVLISGFWIYSSNNGEYIPGEKIEGLTSDLGRNLPVDYPRVLFADVSKEAGIDFVHFNSTRTIQLPEDMGSGAAWGDYNNDGWMDLYLVNFNGSVSSTLSQSSESASRSALYRNNCDGTFTDVSEISQTGISNWGNGAAWGDIDNDGWIDIVVTAYGRNTLFRNNSNGTFTDISIQSGIGAEAGFWTGASWGDFNKDGFIDLYVCGYVEYESQETENISSQYAAEVPTSINPSSFTPSRNLLYVNNGNNTFSEEAVKAGVSNEAGRSLSATWCDFDEDGWPDLYVANDVSDNVFFRNLRNGTFDEISHSANVADYRGAMGLAVGDWDRDTDMDMFITHWIAQENALYNNLLAQNRGQNTSASYLVKFMDEADRYGLGQASLEYIGFGTSFIDYNNDGFLDLFIVNGSTFQQQENPELLVPMKDKIYWNKGGNEGFFDVSSVSGEYFDREYVGRGAAFADYDNDGDVDVYVANNAGPGILLNNTGGNKNSWLKVKLNGRESNRDAIGARIRIVSYSGIQVSQVGSQSSYLSQNSVVQHFGMANDTKIDSLYIHWPSGASHTLLNLKTNQTIVITESEGIVH